MVVIKSYSKKRIQIIAAIAVFSMLILLGLITALFVFHPSFRTKKGVVVSNVKDCAAIGTSVMKKGGNAVDSAIATLLCETISMPDIGRRGGDFVMTIFNKSTSNVHVLNAREPPQNSTIKSIEKFFGKSDKMISNIDKQRGVPIEIRAYWTAYKKFGGGVSWKEIIEPTINLCKSGIQISAYTAKVINQYKEVIYADPILRDFINPETNDTYIQGHVVIRPEVADMLTIISEKDIEVLVHSTYSNGFDNNTNGVFYTDSEDKYEYMWQKPIELKLKDGKTLLTAPFPATGIAISESLKIIDSFPNSTYSNLTSTEINNILQWVYQTIFYSYSDSNNITEILEDYFTFKPSNNISQWIHNNIVPNISSIESTRILPDDYATTHVNVLAPNGDAVSVTSTDNYNTSFTKTLSSLFPDNNTLKDDLSQFDKNGLVSEKYISVACPIIILDENKNVVLVAGGTGGNKLLSNILQVLVNFLWRDMDIESAIFTERTNSQLVSSNILKPNPTEYEYKNQILDVNNTMFQPDLTEFSAVSAISKSNSSEVKGVYDKKRPGSVSYIT